MATYTLVGALAALALLALAGVVKVALGNGDATRRWLSTLVIILNHTQTLSIIGSLSLQWPPTVIAILRFFRLDISLMRVECFEIMNDAQRLFWLYSFVLCCLFLLLLILPTLVAAVRTVRHVTLSGSGRTVETKGLRSAETHKQIWVDASVVTSVLLSAMLLQSFNTVAAILRQFLTSVNWWLGLFPLVDEVEPEVVDCTNASTLANQTAHCFANNTNDNSANRLQELIERIRLITASRGLRRELLVLPQGLSRVGRSLSANDTLAAPVDSALTETLSRDMVTETLFVAGTLLVLQVVICCGLFRQVWAFRRGVARGTWGTGSAKGSRNLSPRMQHDCVRFLVYRFRSSHRSTLITYWQFVICTASAFERIMFRCHREANTLHAAVLPPHVARHCASSRVAGTRQTVLLLIANIGSEVIQTVDASQYPATRAVALWSQLGSGLLVMSLYLALHLCYQPYTYRKSYEQPSFCFTATTLMPLESLAR